MNPPLQVVWFKRDLRVEDHRPLALAAQAGPVLPLYIVEPGLWAQPDASGRQWAFAAECLEALAARLDPLGQPLCVEVGEALDVLGRIHDRFGIATLWSHEETGNGWTYARDLAVGAWARKAGIPWREERQFGVIRRLKSRNGWAQAWERDMSQPVTPPPRELVPLGGDWPRRPPSAQDLGLAPDPCPNRQPGGRTEGLRVLESFLSGRGRDYRKDMSSPLTAFASSSRLSPHLAWGTVSMREVAQATWARQRELRTSSAPDAGRWRGSLASFSGRQHWHCHFMQKLEDEPRIEFENLHRAYDGVRPDVSDPDRLEAWRQGRTGYPFLDACMRALDAHGWINFRMRAMLMSFASYHLWLPWRDSGLHLARKFVDYEPGIHWPQVQMQSGTTGINTLRIYNPVKQGHDQDPEGAFVRAWIPELATVPDAFIHEPWRWEGAADLAYPPPIVDNAGAMRAARETLHALRRDRSRKGAARAIVNKHGSRRTGMPRAEGGRRTRVSPPDQVQLSLDFG